MATGSSSGISGSDAASGRERILEHAIDAFTRSGLAGARVDAIAAAAGVNKRMIYHYFGSKQGLYRAALDAAPGSAADASAPADLAHWAAGCEVPLPLLKLLLWDGLQNEQDDDDGPATPPPEPTNEALGLAEEIDVHLLKLMIASFRALPHVCPTLVRQLTGHSPHSDAFHQASEALVAQVLRRARRPKQKLVLKPATRPGA